MGHGAKIKDHKRTSCLKPSGAGRDWVRQPWDPEYTPSGDITPKRAYLNKRNHMSDRATVLLNGLWSISDIDLMNAMLDAGFLSDECLSPTGEVLCCPGVVETVHSASSHPSTGSHTTRQLRCVGVSNANKHRIHWLTGSVFQGHRLLSIRETIGVIQCFAAKKSNEATAMDTGLHRTTVQPLLDRLRLMTCLVAASKRESMKYENCQVGIDEAVVRKVRVFETNRDLLSNKYTMFLMVLYGFV